MSTSETETPEMLRARARKVRECAQYADSSRDRIREMKEADELDRRAAELEEPARPAHQ